MSAFADTENFANQKHTGNAHINTEDTDTNTVNTDTNTGNTHINTEDTDTNTGNMDTNTGNMPINTDTNTGNMDTNTGNTHKNTTKHVLTDLSQRQEDLMESGMLQRLSNIQMVWNSQQKETTFISQSSTKEPQHGLT